MKSLFAQAKEMDEEVLEQDLKEGVDSDEWDD
jgi:hypothetical protein